MDVRQNLVEDLRRRAPIAVMLSGGLDSAVLACLARTALGERAFAVTVDSPVVPRYELAAARALAENIGIGQVLLALDELAYPEFALNPPQRCYHCRKIRDRAILAWARDQGFATVADGMIADDLQDYRPGLVAANEDGIWHPFIVYGVTKLSVRAWARDLGLPGSERPATVGLCSRFPYGEPITHRALVRVEQAEDFIRGLGFEVVRVRCLPAETALVEVENPETALAMRERIVAYLKQVGFRCVGLDLEGYQRGKLNRQRS